MKASKIYTVPIGIVILLVIGGILLAFYNRAELRWSVEEHRLEFIEIQCELFLPQIRSFYHHHWRLPDSYEEFWLENLNNLVPIGEKPNDVPLLGTPGSKSAISKRQAFAQAMKKSRRRIAEWDRELLLARRMFHENAGDLRKQLELFSDRDYEE